MEKNKNWWKNKVAYQVYPRSFYDADGDGTGDLKGITQKLGYLQKLGIDILWLCPVYRSPMDDGGYDISDYYDINPQFGTMADMDQLLAEAKKRGIRVLMDLVVNHCSDEHPWFRKGLAEPDSAEAGYFYFKTSRNGPPNNWRSMFGGSAWEKCGTSPEGDRYYLHLFSKKQPDLNWENPALRAEIYKMVNFWLEKGLGGFRIDAITHLKKDPSWASLPPDGDDGMVGCFQSTRNFPGIGDFLTELREQTFDRYECMTVAEAAGVPYEQLGEYIGANGYFDTLFDFTYSEPYNYGKGWHTCLGPGEWSFTGWRDAIFHSQLATQKIGYGAVYFENHDYPRAINKFIREKDRNYASQTMLGTLFFFLRGIPFIYQGEELGMTNTRMESIEDYDDISTKNHYRLALEDGLDPAKALRLVGRYSRDNGRVPFPWNAGKNGGFTTGTPWMKVHPDYRSFDAEDEMKDSGSVYAFYRKMIDLRKDPVQESELIYGYLTPMLTERDDLIAYRRGERTVVFCSFADHPITVKLGSAVEKVLLSNTPDEKRHVGQKTLTLQPFEGDVFVIQA